MKFKKYSEIENTYNSSIIDKIRFNNLDAPSIMYGCYRKLDGSNLQFSIDEQGSLQVGSRNQLVTGTNFMNWKAVAKRDGIKEKLSYIKSEIAMFHINNERLNDWLKTININKFSLTMFGEICGGLYRHPDVERDNTSVRIQGRIDYSPSNQWVPFDLRLTCSGSSFIVDMDLLKNLCDMANLKCQIEEFRGTFDECLNFSPVFNDDTGHRFWGLPIIENNVAEGVVIKPIIPTFIGESRIILKNKNPKYKERIRATKTNNKANPGIKDRERYWFDILKEYMNENRVLTAISKVGCENFGNIMKESCCDALKDFRKENPKFEEDERQNDPKDFNVGNITKAFNKYSSNIVREVFLKNRKF